MGRQPRPPPPHDRVAILQQWDEGFDARRVAKAFDCVHRDLADDRLRVAQRVQQRAQHPVVFHPRQGLYRGQPHLPVCVLRHGKQEGQRPVRILLSQPLDGLTAHLRFIELELLLEPPVIICGRHALAFHGWQSDCHAVPVPTLYAGCCLRF